MYNLIDAAELLRNRAESRLSERIEALPERGGEITCRVGCSACCRQFVVVSPMEAHALAEWVAARPELAERLMESHAQWREALAAQPELVDRIVAFVESEGYVSGPEGGALELAYWQAQRPCPFLEENRCSVYPVRPFACQEHHVLSDPAICAEDFDHAVPADTRMEFRAVANYVGVECYRLPDHLIPLPMALEYAVANAEERERTAEEEALLLAMAIGLRQARRALALMKLAERNSG
jgi:Fe-S-cluster containining protein